MGTWAAGVYGNDAALDWMGDLIGSLSGEINENIADFDEGNGDSLLAALDTIAVLCANSGNAPPKPAEVDGWHRNYFRCFDTYITGLDPDVEYLEAQRKVISDVFSRLAELSANFWDRKRRQ